MPQGEKKNLQKKGKKVTNTNTQSAYPGPEIKTNIFYC